MRLSRLTRANALAASSRPYWISRSVSSPHGGMRSGFCRCCHGRPSYSKPGSAMTTRSGATSAVPTSSATLVTILKPTQTRVQREDEEDGVLVEEVRVTRQGQVEAAEGGAPVARDRRRGVEPAAAVGAVLVERQPDERLDAGEEDEPLFSTVLGVQGEVARDRHRPHRLPV